MQDVLKAYAEFVVRRAWLVLAASLLLTLIIGSGMARLVVDLEMANQLPADSPYVMLDKEIRKEFGGQNFVAIAVVPHSGTVWRKEVLQVVHDITSELLNAPGVIRQAVISLSSPYVRIPKIDGEELIVDYLMRRVPEDDAGIAALREVYRSEPLIKGTVVSNDERAAMVLADFYDERTDAEIDAAVQAAVAKYRSPDIRIAITGHPILQYEEAAVMHRQLLYFSATVASILLMLYLSFGQLQGVVIPTITALLSTAWAMGFMGHVGISLNTWTAAVPLMVVTVAAGHSAQMLKRYYEEFRRLRDRAAAVVASTSRIGVVMIAAGTTAGSGFAALSMLGIPTLRAFGLGVASGIFAAVVLEMTFMIALRALWPGGARETGAEGPLSSALGIILWPLEAAASKRPGLVVAVFAAIALVSIAGYPHLSTEFVVRPYRSRRTVTGKDMLVFERHFPATISLTVLLEGPPDSMKTPEAVRLMRGLTRAMAEDPAVGRTSSVADMVERTFQVFAPDEAENGFPEHDADLIGQLFYLASSPAFERYMDRAFSRSVVFAFLTEEDSGIVRRVLDRARQYLQEHPPHTIKVSLAGGVGPTILAFNEHTVRGKALNIAIVLLVIFLVASALLRTARGGAWMTTPLVMALILNFGLFAWLGVHFDLVGASIAAINVGIGADYAIYFLYRLREEYRASGDIYAALHQTMETSGRAVLFVALAVSAGFAVNIPSDFRGMRLMGIFVSTTMLATCFTAVTLLPALVLLRRPPFIFHLPTAPADESERRAAAAG